ncbi:Hypothetical predicted protein [Octopus vulgaris]|uniref:Craniofacial development protein 2-like n=1 Tax=Octopus vulgaris TaxID=6645 RepID=A0AA36F5C3_OCTVU|nr:Hypothetical predicted protein [Octopus vulgaris]
MHPRSKQWHLIDYIITRQRDSSDVLITRAMPGAKCWTEHKMIRAKLNISIVSQYHKSPKLIRLTFNTARHLPAKYQQEFQFNFDVKFEAIGLQTGGADEKRNQFKDVVTKTAKSVQGPNEKFHRNWFYDNDEAVQII